MNVPGFTAEASLYSRNRRYHAGTTHEQASLVAGQVFPSQGRFEMCGRALERCYHNRCDRGAVRGETLEECANYCEDQWELCRDQAPGNWGCMTDFGCAWDQVCSGHQCVPWRSRPRV